MSKNTLSQEIIKELEKLNNRIDRKIIRGCSYQKEAQRHKDLLTTLQRIDKDTTISSRLIKRSVRRVKSPVHRSLAGGSVRRMFSFKMA